MGHYGLYQIAVQGFSPGAEPDPAAMARVIEYVRQNGIYTIFFESSASDKVAKAIAAETGAETGADWLTG
jgi:zinc transport system substrate-binding protein